MEEQGDEIGTRLELGGLVGPAVGVYQGRVGGGSVVYLQVVVPATVVGLDREVRELELRME